MPFSVYTYQLFKRKLIDNEREIKGLRTIVIAQQAAHIKNFVITTANLTSGTD